LSTRQNRIAASAGTGSGIPVNAQERPDFMSSPDTFDVVEKFPNAIKLVAPHYPSIARRAGIEGKVWVKVLIDRDGSVIDAIIQLESGADAGFEEAALEAARQGVWSPGLQNNQPVRVWVAYEIKFQLR
jgi:protein TonB